MVADAAPAPSSQPPAAVPILYQPAASAMGRNADPLFPFQRARCLGAPTLPAPNFAGVEQRSPETSVFGPLSVRRGDVAIASPEFVQAIRPWMNKPGITHASVFREDRQWETKALSLLLGGSATVDGGVRSRARSRGGETRPTGTP